MSGKPLHVWLSASAAFVIIGCTWAFATARYGGPDEPAHVIRAAAAAHGDVLGDAVAGFEPGYRAVTVPAPLASGDPACYRHSELTPADCAVVSTQAGTIRVATSAGNAPPWYYVIVGLLARGLSSGRAVLGYRMAAVVLCGAVLGYAVQRGSRRGVSTWLLVALTPSAWFLIGVVGTSGIEIALVTLALVEAMNRFGEGGRGASLARVTAPLAACLVLRPPAVTDLVVVGLALIPTLPRPVTARLLGRLALPFAIAGLAAIAWTTWAGLVLRDQRTADTDSLASAFRRSVGGIPTTAHQAVGALGWNEFFAPLLAQAVWVAALGLAVFWVATRSPDRWWHARWAAAALLLPTVIEVIVHRRVGAVWQGRYSIPFAIGGVLYAARCAPPPRAVKRAFVSAAGCAEVLTLWQSLRRYMVGLDGSLTLQGPSWSPPLNAWLLLAINAVAVAWLAALVLRSDDVAEDVDDEVGRPAVVEHREPAA